MKSNQTKIAPGRSNGFLFASLLLALSPAWATPPAPRPAQPGYRTGVLPRAWSPSGPKCVGAPKFQIHRYNEDLYILRESGCSNYEKPFLYLIFGRDKVLLLDTGAGSTDVARVVKKVVDDRSAARRSKPVQLIVAHTHGHGDHTNGDGQFVGLTNTVLVAPNPAAVQSFFGIKSWPEEIVQYDLGGRVLDIIPIPGHEPSSIAVYDRQTALLFTGDTLYPGRLYVGEPSAYARSIKRLVGFTRDRPVAHILGCHIENTRTPYLDYPVETVYQPDEHALELGRGSLLELDDALEQMGGNLSKKIMRDFTIWP